MTEINYLIGKTVSSRQNLLFNRIKASKDRSLLHVVPTKGSVMELETDSKFWLNRRIDTLTGIIHRIFDEDIKPEKYPDYSHVDQMFRQLLIKKALLNRSSDPQGLAYFNSLFSGDTFEKDYPGIYRNISGFFSTLYRNNYEDIYANDLGGRIIWQEENEPGSSDEKYALESDLLWLMGDFEELKKGIKGYDDDDIFRNVRDFLKEKKDSSYLANFNVIILDSLTHISRIEEDILFHIINSVDELWWLIDYEGNCVNPLEEFQKACGKEIHRGKKVSGENHEVEAFRIYYSLISLMDRLRGNGAIHRIEKADDTPYPNPYAAAIYTNSTIDTDAEENTLKIGSFSGEVDEVRAIASEIKRIIIKQGQNPGNIRVIFPELNDYASIVSEVFTEYGLPFSLTKGIPLSSHPFSHIFLKLLQLPIEGFLREDLFGLFSLRIIHPDYLRFELQNFSLDIYTDDHYLPDNTFENLKDLINEETSENISQKPDINLFDTAMRRCGIDRLGRELENISSDKITLFRDIYFDAITGTKNPDEKESLRLEYYGFLYQQLVFKSILAPFVNLLTCGTPEKIVETFEEIVRLLGFPVNIININNYNTGFNPSAKRGLLKRDIRAFTLLNELLNISHREIKLAQRLFFIEESHALLTAFYNTISNRINNKYLLDERNPDVIRVSQWLETRGRSFDYVFAGGLTASRFPLKEEPDFIIPESSRGRFRIIDTVDQSKQLFSSLLKNYEKGLYLSYPENISEKPVQPSQVIQDLYALIDSTAPGASADSNLSWNKNHFYTARNELLNANNIKKERDKNESDPLFSLGDIIIKDESSKEDVIRGIKTYASRSAGNGLFEYDGLIGTASEFINYSKERKKTFSSSSLETLANCPMRYLFQYVYKLKDLDEITPEATSRDIGQFAHDILSLLFKKLADIKTNIYNLGIDSAFSIAVKIIEEYLQKKSILKRLDFAEFYRMELFSGLVRESVVDSREGIIASLLRYEHEEFSNRMPAGIEFEFGSRDKPVQLGNVFIKGYIDRFDRDINSSEILYIYDYKTGYIKSSSNIKKGLAFQLPVYIRALQSIENTGKISASFYSLKRNAFLENAPLKNDVSLNLSEGGIDISGVKLIDEFTDNLTGLIEKGIFHHSVDGNTCEYCEYKFACYKDERRMDHLLESRPDLEIYSGKKNSKKWQEVDGFRKEWKQICQSMEKAETLKTESARRKHYETVIEFKNDLMERRDTLPFTADYMDTLLDEIARFEIGFNA